MLVLANLCDCAPLIAKFRADFQAAVNLEANWLRCGTAMLRAGLQELYYYGNRKLISYFLLHVYCISNFTKIKCMMLFLFQEEV